MDKVQTPLFNDKKHSQNLAASIKQINKVFLSPKNNKIIPVASSII
jgi:hypothetical protein